MMLLRKTLACSIMTGSILLTSLTPVMAKPASLFDPVLSDLQKMIPQGIKVRLPSYIPDTPIPVYAYVFEKPTASESFKIYLGIQKDCDSVSNCAFAGVIAVEPLSGSRFAWFLNQENQKPVDLGQGIKGQLFTKGEGDSTSRVVYWQQDGMKYAVVVATIAVSESDQIKIATSMVNEPAVEAKNS